MGSLLLRAMSVDLFGQLANFVANSGVKPVSAAGKGNVSKQQY
jgi:hypothetical protein